MIKSNILFKKIQSRTLKLKEPRRQLPLPKNNISIQDFLKEKKLMEERKLKIPNTTTVQVK